MELEILEGRKHHISVVDISACIGPWAIMVKLNEDIIIQDDGDYDLVQMQVVGDYVYLRYEQPDVSE